VTLLQALTAVDAERAVEVVIVTEGVYVAPGVIIVRVGLTLVVIESDERVVPDLRAVVVTLRLVVTVTEGVDN
jgi:hypothetical protein